MDDKRAVDHFEIDSVDSMAGTFQVAPIQYLQTSAEVLEADVYRISTPKLEVRDVAYRSDVFIRVGNPYPRFSIALGLSGEGSILGVQLTRSNLAWVSGDNGVVARLKGASRWCNAAVDRGLMNRLADRHQYELPGEDGSHGMPFSAHSALARKLTLIARGSTFGHLTNDQLEEEVALTVLRSVNPTGRTYGVRRDRHWSIVHRIMDYLHAEYGSQVTITGLCDLVDLSERSLQYVFRNATGMSIERYLMRYRLHQARLLLVSGRIAKVSDAASICGIPHTGRFASYYREVFGESPSRTLVTGLG